MDDVCPYHGRRGCKTYLVLYYPSGDVHTSPIKFKDRAILKDLFGRNIFDKGGQLA